MRRESWLYYPSHRQVCRVLDTSDLWGSSLARIWLPLRGEVVTVPATSLRPLAEAGLDSPAYITYVAAAARIADALAREALLAPLEASVIPLPHQIYALSRAVAGEGIRYLLADEVGLGKTIEAGLILRELKLRGLVKRALVVAPRGLVNQWIAEMRNHFNEEFRLLDPGEFSAYRRFLGRENIWGTCDQVVCSMDAVKPVEARRGWTRERVAAHNRDRYDDLLLAGWDLIIVDEAHRLGGSDETTARYQLGLGLAEVSPYLLLLSATPHQGKSDAFRRLMALLEKGAFPDQGGLTPQRVHPFVIRTEKRRAVDALGQPLFKPRETRLVSVAWGDAHRIQRRLYAAVTDYVREGYNLALREKKNYIGFLMVLLQRLVTSSTRAIRVALERRLQSLTAPEGASYLWPPDEGWLESDAEEGLEALLAVRLKAWRNEREEVEKLLGIAKEAQSLEREAKAEALLELMYRLQEEDADPHLKLLVFTEFRPTQEMLREFLEARGFSVVCLNGSMDIDQRVSVQEAFAAETRVLVSTEAGGEGLNLQFCHVVVNYDLPWNPMRLEQRIGRVDRIGQTRTVKALNFTLADTVEHRVREVLEEKLEIIWREFGVDKAGDVLDSVQAGELFDEVYMEALLQPEGLDGGSQALAAKVREQARAAREMGLLLAEDRELDLARAGEVLGHPLPHWVEAMTVAWLGANGGGATRTGKTWSLVWPDGARWERAVFTAQEAAEEPAAAHLTLEEPRLRDLVAAIPPFVPGQPIARVRLDGLAKDLAGVWSLWRVGIGSVGGGWRRQVVVPLFLHDDGRCLHPSARHIWERLLFGQPEVCGCLEGSPAEEIFRLGRLLAEAQGRDTFAELAEEHRRARQREREKGEYAFAVRRRAVERIGLPAVRAARLRGLEGEEARWRRELAEGEDLLPALEPLVLLRVEGARHG